MQGEEMRVREGSLTEKNKSDVNL